MIEQSRPPSGVRSSASLQSTPAARADSAAPRKRVAAAASRPPRSSRSAHDSCRRMRLSSCTSRSIAVPCAAATAMAFRETPSASSWTPSLMSTSTRPLSARDSLRASSAAAGTGASVRIANAVAASARASSPCPKPSVRWARIAATSPTMRGSPASSASSASSVRSTPDSATSSGSSPRIRSIAPSRTSSLTRKDGPNGRAAASIPSRPRRAAARPSGLARCCQRNLAVARSASRRPSSSATSAAQRHSASPASRAQPCCRSDTGRPLGWPVGIVTGAGVPASRHRGMSPVRGIVRSQMHVIT